MYDDVPNSATDLQNKDRVSQFQTHMVKHKKYVFFICSSAFTHITKSRTATIGLSQASTAATNYRKRLQAFSHL